MSILTAKLLKIGQIHKQKPHRLFGEAERSAVRSIIISVEVDACDVFGAVGEAVEGDFQCGGARRREDVG